MRCLSGFAIFVICASAAALGACRPGEHLEGGPAPTVEGRPKPAPSSPAATNAASGNLARGAEPNVRIGITIDTTTTMIGSPVEFDVQTVSGKTLAHADAGSTWSFSVDGDGRITAKSGEDVKVNAEPAPLRVVPRDLPFVVIDGRQYRGEVSLLTHGNRISAINITDMESYLLGVVPRELGKRPASEIEALKAQAVAARTYAVGNMGGHSNIGFDFYPTVLDQVYGGTVDEDSIVSRAVRETRGEIVTYGGKPIMAYYSSTCGGVTAAIEESWPTRQPLPYLRSRSDRIPGTDDDYYCKTSSKFNWKTDWTRQQLLDVLAMTLKLHTRGAVTSVHEVNDVKIASKSPSGRATIDVKVDGRRYTVRADSLRWVLRPGVGAALLNSSYLKNVTVDKASNGTVDHLSIEGGGWGHGIGMCQVGAMARARAGQSYKEILKAYYTDVNIEPLYR
jgi:stage II sporulation protein D